MNKLILPLALALATSAASFAYAAGTTAAAAPGAADDCFYKAVNAAVSNADNAVVLMPGKALKGMLALCESKTQVATVKYQSVLDLKDEDMVPTSADTKAEPQDLVIE